MPTIIVDPSDLNGLLGEKRPTKEIHAVLEKLGIKVEKIDSNGLNLEVPNSRPDLFSVEGLARALNGFLEIETGIPDYEIKNPTLDLDVDASMKGIRQVIVAGVIEKAEFNEASLSALMDLQEKLHETIGRERKKISIGTYGLDEVTPPISYTTISPEGRKFVPLDFKEELTPAEILQQHPKGVEYRHLIQELDRYPLLIDSDDQVLSMPPIINSESTRVTLSTKRLLVDVTGFDERVARQALKVIMAAAGERKCDLRAVNIQRPEKKFRTPSSRKLRRRLDVSFANEMLGLELSVSEASKIMERMRYSVEDIRANKIYVLVPFYRFDIMHEVDLVEDLAIGFGYDNFEPTLPSIVTSGKIHPIERISQKARRTLTGLGLTEVMTFILTNPDLNFYMMRAEDEAAIIANPISEEYSILRTWLLPGLMSVLRENRHHELPQNIFEVGDVILLDENAETGAKNIRRTSGITIGEESNFTGIKAVAESLLRELKIEWEVSPMNHPSFIKGRVAEFIYNGKHVGMVGEIHPEIILNFELEYPVAAFELDLPVKDDW